MQVWDKALCDVASDGGECLTLVWELDDLRALGSAMSEFVKSQVTVRSIVAMTALLACVQSCLSHERAKTDRTGVRQVKLGSLCPHGGTFT